MASFRGKKLKIKNLKKKKNNKGPGSNTPYGHFWDSNIVTKMT